MPPPLESPADCPALACQAKKAPAFYSPDNLAPGNTNSAKHTRSLLACFADFVWAKARWENLYNQVALIVSYLYNQHN
jgi:hypothetical protein